MKNNVAQHQIGIADLIKIVCDKYADGFVGCLSFTFADGAVNIIISDDEDSDLMGRASMLNIELYRHNIVDVKQVFSHEVGHWAALNMSVNGQPLENDYAEELTAHLVGRSLYPEADWTDHIDVAEYELEEEEIEEARQEAEKRITTLSHLTFSLV